MVRDIISLLISVDTLGLSFVFISLQELGLELFMCSCFNVLWGLELDLQL